MVGQCLSNKNENTTVAKSKKKLQLNKALGLTENTFSTSTHVKKVEETLYDRPAIF